MLKEEITVFKVVKFTAIVALDETNRKKEVNGNVSLEIEKKGVDIGFISQRKGPYKVCIIDGG